MEVPRELQEAAAGASQQQLRRQQGGSPPRRQQHRQPAQQLVGTEPAPAPALDAASALDLLSMLAASELATAPQATSSQPPAPAPASTLSASAADSGPWTVLHVRESQDEGKLPGGNGGAAAVIPLPPASKQSPVYSAAPPPPPHPPPFVAAVSNESAASCGYSTASNDADSAGHGHRSGSGSGSSTSSGSSGERRRKRSARDFLEEQERQTRRGSPPSAAARTGAGASTSASSSVGGSLDGVHSFRLPFPDGTAVWAFSGGSISGGSSDGSVNRRSRSGSASSSVARRISTMMIFDPVTASGGLQATISNPGSPFPPPGLFPSVPVSRRFLQEATDRSIARGREGVMRGIQLLADGGVLDRQRAMDSLQFLQAMTLLSGRDVSVGVAPMIASLLAERPQAFITHGRPSPPIASIFGRFTADESACYVISDVSPSGQSIVTCNARMSELFMSTSEVQGLLAQVGTASVFIWGHFLSEQGAAELYAGVARCLLDPWVPPQIDVVVTCKTRHGAQLICLASLAMRLNEHGRSVMVLRLLPLVHRTFGPVGPIPSANRPRPPPPAVRSVGGRPVDGAARAVAGRGRVRSQQQAEHEGGQVGWGDGPQPQSSRPGRGGQTSSGLGGLGGRGECRDEAGNGHRGCYSSKGIPKRRRVLGATAAC